MKSIKKLGAALALALSCLLAAPVTPLEGSAEGATADMRRGQKVREGICCTDNPCNPRPYQETICCEIIIVR